MAPSIPGGTPELLKSVYSFQSYCENKNWHIFMAHGVVCTHTFVFSRPLTVVRGLVSQLRSGRSDATHRQESITGGRRCESVRGKRVTQVYLRFEVDWIKALAILRPCDPCDRMNSTSRQER